MAWRNIYVTTTTCHRTGVNPNILDKPKYIGRTQIYWINPNILVLSKSIVQPPQRHAIKLEGTQIYWFYLDPKARPLIWFIAWRYKYLTTRREHNVIRLVIWKLLDHYRVKAIPITCLKIVSDYTFLVRMVNFEILESLRPSAAGPKSTSGLDKFGGLRPYE